MSIKLYNGYRIDRCDLQTLQERMILVRDQARKVCKRMVANAIYGLLIQMFDNKVVGLSSTLMDEAKENNRNRFLPWASASLYVMDAFRKALKSDVRNPSYDFGMNVCIIPHNNKIFALLFTEKNEYRTLWEGQPWVSKYPYWNNCDKPRNVSYRAWNVRYKEWMAALGKDAVPSRVGFTFEFVSAYTDMPKRLDILAKLNNSSVRNRATALARMALINRYAARVKMPNTSKILEYCSRLSGNLDDMKKVDELASKIAPKLKSRFTESDLSDYIGVK